MLVFSKWLVQEQANLAPLFSLKKDNDVADDDVDAS